MSLNIAPINSETVPASRVACSGEGVHRKVGGLETVTTAPCCCRTRRFQCVCTGLEGRANVQSTDRGELAKVQLNRYLHVSVSITGRAKSV